MTFSSNDN